MIKFRTWKSVFNWFWTFAESGEQILNDVNNIVDEIEVTTPALVEETYDEEEQNLRDSLKDIYKKCLKPKYAHICRGYLPIVYPYPSRPAYPYPSRPGYTYPSRPGFPYPSRPVYPYPSSPGYPYPPIAGYPYPPNAGYPYPPPIYGWNECWNI